MRIACALDYPHTDFSQSFFVGKKLYVHTQSDPRWRAELDINGDLIIDAKDQRILIANYGQKW